MDDWTLWQIILPVIIIIVSFIIGIIIRLTILKRLVNLARKSKARMDDIFMESLRSVIVLFLVLAGIVTNYYQPQKALNLLIEVGIDYSSNLEEVEQVTLEVAQETLKEVPGGEKKFEPFLRYHTFGDSSINFTVYLRCKEFYDKFLVQHEFIKRLKKKYDQKGINIPFPIRTVIMQKD